MIKIKVVYNVVSFNYKGIYLLHPEVILFEDLSNSLYLLSSVRHSSHSPLDPDGGGARREDLPVWRAAPLR